MKIKNIILASALLASLPVAVQAQETSSYDNLKVSCESGAECSDFGVNFQQGDEVAQYTPRRTRTRRTRGSDDKKIYAGATLGLFFPSEIDDYRLQIISGDATDLQSVDPSTGFGGSIYGGYKFSEMIGADIEAFVFGGDSDPLDSSYTSYGFFINPRFTYSFNPENFKSFYVFASPGIGIAGVDFGDEISDASQNSDDSGTGFALQAKVGAGYPVTDTIDIIGQVRYFNAFNVLETTQFGEAGEVSESEDQDFNSLGFELGANFKF